MGLDVLAGCCKCLSRRWACFRWNAKYGYFASEGLQISRPEIIRTAQYACLNGITRFAATWWRLALRECAGRDREVRGYVWISLDIAMYTCSLYELLSKYLSALIKHEAKCH